MVSLLLGPFGLSRRIPTRFSTGTGFEVLGVRLRNFSEVLVIPGEPAAATMAVPSCKVLWDRPSRKL